MSAEFRNRPAAGESPEQNPLGHGTVRTSTESSLPQMLCKDRIWSFSPGHAKRCKHRSREAFAACTASIVCGGDKTIHWNASVLLSVAE